MLTPLYTGMGFRRLGNKGNVPVLFLFSILRRPTQLCTKGLVFGNDSKG